MTMFIHPLLATVMCIVSVMHVVRIAKPGVARARPHAWWRACGTGNWVSWVTFSENPPLNIVSYSVDTVHCRSVLKRQSSTGHEYSIY